MKQIRLTLKELETKTIPIGREGENDYTVVTIDCAEVFEKHPNAAATMRAQNYRKQIYPVTIVRDGNDIVWTVKESDLTAKGDGRIQLTFTEGTIIHKTVIGRTLVLKSLITNGPAPDPVQDWLDEAEDALEDLVSAEVHKPIIGEDGYWYKWNQEAEEYQKTDTKAQGEDGQDGHTPEKGVDYWTAADKAEMESDVAGAIIDDTSTALDKTWSASKSGQLLSAFNGLFLQDQLANIFTPQDIANVLDGYILKNGVPQTQYGSGYCVSDYIPVTGGDTLTFNFLPWNASTDSSFRAAEYNSNKEYIKRLTGSPVTLSENTAYIRFSIKKSDFGNSVETAITHLNTNLVITNGSKVQFTGIDEEKNQFQSVDSVRKTGWYFVDASNYEMLILSKMNGVNNKDIGIKMKHFLNNDSWQFSSFGTVANNTPFVSNDPSSYVEFMSTAEDFFGPIVGFADDNGDGDDPNEGHFTGGMHRFNSKNTARVISFDVYYDGRKIPSFVGYCDTIDIIIKQNLQVSNTLKNDGTGREVVTEIIRLHFENGEIKVETEFIALEGMSIRTFYFMQGNHNANGMGANGIRYIGSEANRGINSMDVVSDSGDLYGRTMRMLSDVIQMDLTIDDVDLGRFAHVTGNNIASAFVNTYNGYSKCYFNAIRSNDDMVHLDTGESCMARGSIRLGMFE